MAGISEWTSAFVGPADCVLSVGWCKNLDKQDSWFKYDDAVVGEVKEDAIAALEGGGEGASAYLLLYRTKPFA